MEVNIVDSFLFSEPHEEDLLFLKLELEQSVVSRWILQENAFTSQGDPKELHAKNILQKPRFDKFRDRITVVSMNTQFLPGNTEQNNFIRETNQRAGFISQEYREVFQEIPDNKKTFFMVSDVDELIDFSDPNRTDRFIEYIKNQHHTCWVQRLRYWYDYDNKCFLDDLHIPLVPFDNMAQDVNTAKVLMIQARHYKDRNRCFGGLENPLAFEYSYVFKSIEDLWRKKCTYPHTNFTMKSLEEGLRLNAWPRPVERGEGVGEHDFFEMVELTETNSPKYVRDNLSELKTNIVDPSYKENRGQ